MKILNLYAGIGGNRKLWGDEHEITAVEYKPEIAAIYSDLFPNDTMVIGDAHEYLLKHYREFDFIWSSPPCPTHSQWGWLRMLPGAGKDASRKSEIRYPDMRLYQEILFLTHFFKGKWCVENVRSYYEPLIPPHHFGGHYFWTNFQMPDFAGRKRGMSKNYKDENKRLAEKNGFDLSKYKGVNKRLLLRNCVEPELGKHILDAAITPYIQNGQLNFTR